MISCTVLQRQLAHFIRLLAVSHSPEMHEPLWSGRCIHRTGWPKRRFKVGWFAPDSQLNEASLLSFRQFAERISHVFRMLKEYNWVCQVQACSSVLGSQAGNRFQNTREKDQGEGPSRPPSHLQLWPPKSCLDQHGKMATLVCLPLIALSRTGVWWCIACEAQMRNPTSWYVKARQLVFTVGLNTYSSVGWGMLGWNHTKHHKGVCARAQGGIEFWGTVFFLHPRLAWVELQKCACFPWAWSFIMPWDLSVALLNFRWSMTNVRVHSEVFCI